MRRSYAEAARQLSCPQRQRPGGAVFASAHCLEQNSFPGWASHVHAGCAHSFFIEVPAIAEASTRRRNQCRSPSRCGFTFRRCGITDSLRNSLAVRGSTSWDSRSSLRSGAIRRTGRGIRVCFISSSFQARDSIRHLSVFSSAFSPWNLSRDPPEMSAKRPIKEPPNPRKQALGQHEQDGTGNAGGDTRKNPRPQVSLGPVICFPRVLPSVHTGSLPGSM